MNIAQNCVVSMRYTMKNSRQEVLEDTLHALPVHYLHGSGTILAVLQEQLVGLKAGDKKKVYLQTIPGITEEAFCFEVSIDEVRAALPEEIVLGYPVQAIVQACEADCACYNTGR